MNNKKSTAIAMIAALVSSLFLFSAKAQDGIFADGECQMPGTVFYYVNGILTSYKDADKARESIEEVFEWLDDDSSYEFKLSYNQTHGLFRDILKTFRLKSKEENEDKIFWQLLSGEKPISVNVGDLSETMASEIASRLPQAQPGRAISEDDLIHTERFRRDLENGKRVIVIAHSQGSLIANAAVSSLWRERYDYRNSIDKINVASPSSLYNKNNGESISAIQYVTAYDDRVINGLRFLAPNTLRGNIHNDPGIFNDHRDWLNHGFLTSYFGTDFWTSRLKSQMEIYSLVDHRLDILIYPWQEDSESPVTIYVHRSARHDPSYPVVLLLIDLSSEAGYYDAIYKTGVSQVKSYYRRPHPILENPEVIPLPCRQSLSKETHYSILMASYNSRENIMKSGTGFNPVRVEIVVGNTKKVFFLDRPEEWVDFKPYESLADIIIKENEKGDVVYTIENALDQYTKDLVPVKTFTIESSSLAQKLEAPTLAYHARIHAIPPPTTRDRALIRVRCEDREQNCKLWLDCTAPKEDRAFSGWVSKVIPARGSIALDAREIADIVGDWSGKGRLACDIGSARKFSAQIWIRSGDGMLVNTSAFARSRRFAYHDGDRYRRYEGVDIDSIPAPGGDDESNLRIRCVDDEECTNTRLECAEDDGTLHEARLGTIPVARVRHLQSEELAELIDYRWEGLSLSCEVQSDRSITVQALTRTAGILVNNGISNEEP